MFYANALYYKNHYLVKSSEVVDPLHPQHCSQLCCAMINLKAAVCFVVCCHT